MSDGVFVENETSKWLSKEDRQTTEEAVEAQNNMKTTAPHLKQLTTAQAVSHAQKRSHWEDQQRNYRQTTQINNNNNNNKPHSNSNILTSYHQVE